MNDITHYEIIRVCRDLVLVRQKDIPDQSV